MIVEGQSVSYVGDDPMIGVGTRGSVLSVSGSSVHVQWQAGVRVSEIDLIPVDDLIPYRRTVLAEDSPAAQIEQSFEVAPLISVAVRETYEDQGPEGVVAALDEAGHLSMLSEYANEAVGYVAMRIRQDPTFQIVLAHLDESEGEALAQTVASALIAEYVTYGEE